MRNLLKNISAMVGAAAISLSANAFDNIYIFGDSLSDTGNASAFTGGQVPERFSNGPVAVDFVTGAFGLTATPSLFLTGQELGNNYAVGGALAIDADGDESTFDTNLPTQVNTFLAYNGGVADPAALYVVVIGGNDLFAAQQIRSTYLKTSPGAERKAIRKASKARVDQAVASLEAQLTKLIASGAQNIVVGNAPDIALVPATDELVAGLLAQSETKAEERRANKIIPLSSKLTARYNRGVAKTVARLERTFGLDIVEWDVEAFVSNQIEDAEELGYTNVDTACATDGQLPLCEGYVFVDGVHPTTVVHQRAGTDILSLLP